MKRYFKIWYLLASSQVQGILTTKLTVVTFVFTKLFRFFLFLSFMYFLLQGVKNVSGYSKDQTLLFFLTFSFLGTVGQMLFREVYRFNGRVMSGDFDFDLIKPINPLLRNLTGGFDFMDLLTLPVIFSVLVFVISLLKFHPVDLFIYILLCINGIIIMTATHIFIAGFGIILSEISQAISLYRDIETLGRFPVDIYKTPLNNILTFILPVGFMFTIPSKALLGLLSWQWILMSFIIGFILLKLSIRFWNFSIKKYTSASS